MDADDALSWRQDVEFDPGWGLSVVGCEWVRLEGPAEAYRAGDAANFDKIAHCYKVWLRDGHYYRVLPVKMMLSGGLQAAAASGMDLHAPVQAFIDGELLYLNPELQRQMAAVDSERNSAVWKS